MSISRHTAYNIAGAVLPLGITLLTVPLYLDIVGIERYGILALCWVVLGYFGFLDLGLGAAVSQRIASAPQDSPRLAESVFWTASWLSLAAGLLSALLFAGGAALYFSLGAFQTSFEGEVRDAVPLLAAILPIVMLSSVTAGALHGRQRFLALNLVAMCSSSLMSILPLLAAYFWSPKLPALLMGALAARLVGLALQYASCRRAVPLARPAFPQRSLIPSLLKFGGWVTVTTAVWPLLITVDRLAIGALIGAAAVAAYSIPLSLVARMSIIPGAVASALFPRFAAADGEEGRRLQSLALMAVAVTMTPICVLAIAAVKPFFTMWLGLEVAAVSAPVAAILVAGAWASSIAMVPLTMLQGSGRPEAVAKIQLIELLPYWLILAGCLMTFGLLGAAIAWSLRTTADCLLLCRRSGLGLGTLKPLALPFLLVLSALAALLLNGSLEWALLASAFALACIWSLWNLPAPMRERLGMVGAFLRGSTRTH